MEVGSYEAKTHLPRLLEKVAQGATITITKHGTPVAMLVPVRADRRRPRGQAIDDLQRFREDKILGDADLKKMIEQGRR